MDVFVRAAMNPLSRIGELNDLPVSCVSQLFGRVLFRNLLRNPLNRRQDLGGHCLAYSKFTAFDPIHRDLIWQAVQNLAEAERLRKSEALTGDLLSSRQTRRVSFPRVHCAAQSAGHDRIDQDDVLLALPACNQFKSIATLNLRRNSHLTQALGHQHSRSIVHAIAVATANDLRLHSFSWRSTVSFRKCVAQEMQGS